MKAPSLSTFARLVLIPGFIALGVGACAYRHEKGTATDPDLAPKDGARSELGSPSFVEVRDQVFAKRCKECHVDRQLNPYTDYAETFADRDSINNRVFVRRNMPKDGPLSADDASLLQRWLNAGAPQEARQAPPPELTPGTEEISPNGALPTWAQVQAGFFTPYCIRCHNARVHKGDLDLTDWEQTRGRALISFKRVMIDRDMPENKALYDRITGESKLLMVKWIDGGMPGPEPQR